MSNIYDFQNMITNLKSYFSVIILEQLFIVYRPYIIVTQIMRPIKCMIEDIEKGLF